MGYISIDLGTTNIKVAAFSDDLKRIRHISRPVKYQRDGRLVEFDAEEYFHDIVAMLREHMDGGSLERGEAESITLTGQAESLVVLGSDMRPLRPAISWMDERSDEECEYLRTLFTDDECYAATGQQAVIPTWPATKVLWIKKHEPEVYAKTAKYMLLKDYIAYRLSGVAACEKSIATFSFWYDIINDCYWKKMLDAVGIREEQLCPLTEPGSVLGEVIPSVAAAVGLKKTLVNAGTLDHFAGMIGTGNIREGIISESTGTVMALATLARAPFVREAALHYGPFPKSYVYLPTCESGGSSLEWFKNNLLPEMSFSEIDAAVSDRGDAGLAFLPYIVGSNAPEYDAEVSGLFCGLRAQHDRIDMARAVMEGVALLLDRNIRYIARGVDRIISTGGGAKSDVWSQLKADITGLTVEIPQDSEAALLGAAVMGAVTGGRFSSYEEATGKCVHMRKRFIPDRSADMSWKKERYDLLYRAMKSVQR